MEEFIKETTNLINARFPIIQINTNEETRLINTLNTISKNLNKKRYMGFVIGQKTGQ